MKHPLQQQQQQQQQTLATVATVGCRGAAALGCPLVATSRRPPSLLLTASCSSLKLTCSLLPAPHFTWADLFSAHLPCLPPPPPPAAAASGLRGPGATAHRGGRPPSRPPPPRRARPPPLLALPPLPLLPLPLRLPALCSADGTSTHGTATWRWYCRRTSSSRGPTSPTPSATRSSTWSWATPVSACRAGCFQVARFVQVGAGSGVLESGRGIGTCHLAQLDVWFSCLRALPRFRTGTSPTCPASRTAAPS